MIVIDCDGAPETTDQMMYHSASDTYGYAGVDGDAVPHSDLLDTEGGENDYDDFLNGEWVYYSEPPTADPEEWVCGCVHDHLGDAWAEQYVTYWTGQGHDVSKDDIQTALSIFKENV